MDGMASDSIFAGGGELGALMRSHHWPKTPLGPVEQWSSSLKTAVTICVNSRVPMAVWWGKEFSLLYNEAFIPILGSRHPQALGQSAKAIFPESWHIIGPQLESAFATKRADRVDDLLIPALRTGYLEESYYTYSYSPLFVETGKVGGVFSVIAETTRQILSERRQATLTALSAQRSDGKAVDEIYRFAIETLAHNPSDVPFAALYRLNLEQTQAQLIEHTSAGLGALPMPEKVELAGADPWLFQSVLHMQTEVTLTDLPDRFGQGVPTGVFSLPVTQARVLPIWALNKRKIVALLVMGINPARALDESYCSFLDAIAGQIASAIANANRQTTERALEASEEKLKSFVDAGVVGILFADVYGTVHDANEEFLRIVGYTREDVCSGRLRWTDITPEEYLSYDKQGIAEATLTGACKPYEKEYIHKDGHRVPVLVGYHLLGAAREEAVAFIVDLSKLKRAEASLKQREAELRLVTNAVPVLISFVDADQRYRFNNRGYEEWFECSAEEIYGKHLREVVGERAYASILPYVEKVLTGQQVTYESELLLEEGDIAGSDHYFTATYVPRFAPSGEVEGFVALITDITERKRIELEREQLLQREHAAREDAERANRIKDEFLAVVSHELRTPLNPILGWSQLLRRGQLSEEKTVVAIETIERNAKLQVQLIDDLLDISRILRGKMSLEENLVNLKTVILAALGTVRLAAEAKSIEMTTDLSSCSVMGDSGRLQQIVWNLLSNAVKFTPDSGRVSVSLRAVGLKTENSGLEGSGLEGSGLDGSALESPNLESPNLESPNLESSSLEGLQTKHGYAQISVTDTGKGINANFLPYVFEHFRQEDYSTTRQFGGMGLGLAIARQLVELHGGTIAVDSPGEEQGATFTVKFPLVDVPKDRVTEESTADWGDLSGVNILVVDDEPDAQEITAYVLEHAKATVTVVASGAEALQVFHRDPPDVLISDIGMSQMDGYMLIRHIRGLPPEKGGEVCAIALTAYAGENDQALVLAAGFHRHIAKPIEPEVLVMAVQSLLRQEAKVSR